MKDTSKMINKDNKWTKEKVLSFFVDTEAKFVSYYKYIFTYKITKENKTLTILNGGSGDEIYHIEVYPDSGIKISSIIFKNYVEISVQDSESYEILFENYKE